MITKIHEFERKGVKNEVYRISNENGAELDILTYGARMIRLTAPDKNGNIILDYSYFITSKQGEEDTK